MLYRCEEAEAFALDPANRAVARRRAASVDSISSAIKLWAGRNNVGRPNGRRKKRHMSASARARIANAQRARWAKVKARKNA